MSAYIVVLGTPTNGTGRDEHLLHYLGCHDPKAVPDSYRWWWINPTSGKGVGPRGEGHFTIFHEAADAVVWYFAVWDFLDKKMIEDPTGRWEDRRCFIKELSA